MHLWGSHPIIGHGLSSILLSEPPPFSYLMGKGVSFQWTVDCQKLFEFLPDALFAEPVMNHPDFTRRFILYIDASQVAVGAGWGWLKESSGLYESLPHSG